LLVDPQFYKAIRGKTPHKGDILEARVYLAQFSGELRPSAEISAAEWTKNPKGYKLSELNRTIINALCRDGYLQMEGPLST
jgi:hypothetical protein